MKDTNIFRTSKNRTDILCLNSLINTKLFKVLKNVNTPDAKESQTRGKLVTQHELKIHENDKHKMYT